MTANVRQARPAGRLLLRLLAVAAPWRRRGRSPVTRPRYMRLYTPLPPSPQPTILLSESIRVFRPPWDLASGQKV